MSGDDLLAGDAEREHSITLLTAVHTMVGDRIVSHRQLVHSGR